MNYEKIYESKMFHLAIAVLLGVGLSFGYEKWIAKKAE
jgi:hypothetical protein